MPKLTFENDALDVRVINFVGQPLTPPPAYGVYIGKLKKIVKQIEQNLLNSASGEGVSVIKEYTPLHCIIAPPRHGKSLLLDTLCVNNERVLVIKITYNGGTNFKQHIETASGFVAIRYFWLRVIKALLGLTNHSLEVLNTLVPPNVTNWNSVKQYLEPKFSVNPFIDRNGDQKNILICVDEITLLTDKLDLAFHIYFFSELASDKRPGSILHNIPFVQFVITGFNCKISKARSSSSKVLYHTLPL